MDVPLCKHVAAILFLGIVKFCPCIVLLQKKAKCRNLHCLALLNKAIFRQCPRVNKECITVTSIAAAVKGNARHKAAALHLILKFADNIGRKVLTTAGIRAVIIHVGAQIAFQCALRFFVGCLIKIAGICLAQQYDLQCIDDR